MSVAWSCSGWLGYRPRDWEVAGSTPGHCIIR